MATWWTPVRLRPERWYGDGRTRTLGDFAHFGPGRLVMSRRAAEALDAVCGYRGEWLETGGDLGFVAWNCTRIIDALDEQHTKGQKLPSGTGYIVVSHYALKADRVDDEPIFKVPQLRASEVFVSDSFVDAVTEHGLGGLRFVEVELT